MSQEASSSGYGDADGISQAIVIPERYSDDVMAILRDSFNVELNDDERETLGANSVVQCTAGHYTGVRPHRDYTCGDVLE